VGRVSCGPRLVCACFCNALRALSAPCPVAAPAGESMGSATAKAIDYSLGRWPALTRYIDDGDLPADNNWVENQIRRIALGRSKGYSPDHCVPANAPPR
jgi:hypothetical protein